MFEPRIEIIVHEVSINEAALDAWANEQAEPAWLGYRANEQEGHFPPRYTGCDVPFWPCEFKNHCHYGMRLEDGYSQRNLKDEEPD
jgi:hypothetical protein